MNPLKVAGIRFGEMNATMKTQTLTYSYKFIPMRVTCFYFPCPAPVFRTHTSPRYDVDSLAFFFRRLRKMFRTGRPRNIKSKFLYLLQRSTTRILDNRIKTSSPSLRKKLLNHGDHVRSEFA